VTCVGPGALGEDCCGRPAARGGLCWAHLKQRERGQQFRPIPERLSSFERVIVAGSAFLEAEDEPEYRMSLVAFRRAAEAWLREEGWQPPARVPSEAEEHPALVS
jgi:hypothetical protein